MESKREKEMKAAQMYIVNDIICQLSIEGKKYPSVSEVTGHWRFPKYARISTEEIAGIIAAVQKIDGFIK